MNTDSDNKTEVYMVVDGHRIKFGVADGGINITPNADNSHDNESCKSMYESRPIEVSLKLNKWNMFKLKLYLWRNMMYLNIRDFFKSKK